MSNPATLPDTLSVISLPEFQDGHSPSNSPVGVQTELFGRGVVPVNPSAPPDVERERLTSATSGRSSGASLRSAALSASLASRLMAKLDLDGSPEYVLTWRRVAMASGSSVYRLRASARRTSANACSGWPTPTVGTPNSMRGQGQDPLKRKAQGHTVNL